MEGTDHIEMTALTAGQADQIARLEEMWPDYGKALQIAAATGGGMSWRTVKGVEYLTRWYQEDGKKKGKSLGRRSPETEATLKEFEDTTLKARRVLREMRDDVALACRLAKAHGIARLPGRLAETLDWFWYTDLNRRMALFGGTALLAYESGSGTLAPPELIKDGHLQVVSHTEDIDLVLPAVDEISEACDVDREGTSVQYDENRFRIRSKADKRLLCEIYLPSFFHLRLESGPAETLREAFDMPWLKSLIVSRDGRPIEVTVQDPRVYAMAAHSLGNDPIWANRAAYAAEMVAENWPDKFDEHQEADFEDLIGGERGGFRGP
jgi:hypothetical protein